MSETIAESRTGKEVERFIDDYRRSIGKEPMYDINSIPPEANRNYCPKCGTISGWYFVGRDSNDYSFSIECECQKSRKSKQRIEESGLSALIKEWTFDSFKTTEPFQQKMARMAISYARNIIDHKDGKQPWLFIGGQSGCGKSFICTAVCGKLMEERIPVLYMQWPTDARKLKAVANDPSFDDCYRDYINIPVLYIDDLLKQLHHEKPLPTDADVRIAFEILNARYIQNKPTIISSEWLSTELREMDEATFGRVVERANGYLLDVPEDPKKDMRLRQK